MLVSLIQPKKWSSFYTERLSKYFIVNDMDSDCQKQGAILLSSCSHSAFQLAKQLLSHRALLSPTEDHRAVYCADVRKLAASCDFSDRLEEMLRDRLICGILNQHI